MREEYIQKLKTRNALAYHSDALRALVQTNSVGQETEQDISNALVYIDKAKTRAGKLMEHECNFENGDCPVCGAVPF